MAATFRSLWFGASPPPALQIGSYTGSGVGLSSSADEVVLFNGAGVLVTGVGFGASPGAAPFATFDNHAGAGSATLPLPVIATPSATGVNGAFVAPGDANELGSPGVSSTSAYNFVLLDRSASEPGVDTLYVADDSAVAANAGGGIQKWIKSGGAWTRAATFSATTTVGFRGLTGRVSNGNVVLIATGAEATADRILKFVDDGSATIPGTVFASSATNQIYRGVAFSPH